MNKPVAVIFALMLLGTLTLPGIETRGENMKTLEIKWQRLVDERGKTCERCGATEKEVQRAFQKLKRCLAPLGIKVTLEEKTLSPTECAKDISQSNRIWVGRQLLEEWLRARVGKSPCDTCCEKLGDDVECRTIKLGEQVYETIPAELILKAGLLAASELIVVQHGKSCCPEKPDWYGCFVE